MDLEDSPEEARFRAEVRQWLSEHAAPRRNGGVKAADPEVRLARARRFQAAKAAQGYAAITWPKEYGGLGGTEIEQLIYLEEEGRFDVESLQGTDFFSIGIHLCGGTLIKCGTDEQRRRFIGPLLRGEEIWCQLFSEPSCGSDLAAVRTKAVRDGDGWRISGQKVWTTGGHYSDYGMALTRTDPTLPKHQGLTMFIVDLKSPGVEIRPIRQMSGDSEFNEIFLDDVRVPDSFRIGGENGGWSVALTTLGQERATAAALSFVAWRDLLALAQATAMNGRPAIEDGRIREQIAECWLNTFGMRLMQYRMQTVLGRGAVPGPEQSIAKLILARQGQKSAIAALDMLGARGILGAEELGEQWRAVEESFFWGPAFRIAGGADEILRNILGERVLGLPPEVRTDRSIAFEQLGE